MDGKYTGTETKNTCTSCLCSNRDGPGFYAEIHISFGTAWSDTRTFGKKYCI